MTEKERKIIETVESYVKEKMSQDFSGHDWFHVSRVSSLAKKIQEKEGGDIFVVQLGSLLHDVFDWKFLNGKDVDLEIEKFFTEFIPDAHDTIREKVAHIIKNVSFKGAKVENRMESLEGKIVQDADKLDALGAIGIARMFAFGGYFRRMIYDPSEKPKLHSNEKEYENNKSSAIAHAYEKLFLLKDMMNTATGKEMAIDRDKYLRDFVKRFLEEWNGVK